MKRLKISLALGLHKKRFFIIIFSTVGFLLNTGGCDELIAPGQGEYTIITPSQNGLLVIGQNDTLFGSSITTYGTTQSGVCKHNVVLFESWQTYSNYIEVWQSRDLKVGNCQYERKFKIYLLEEENPVPGSHTIFFGRAKFHLDIVQENSFIINVTTDTTEIRQGVPQLLNVQIVRAPGFSNSIELSLRPQAGFTAIFNPNPVPGDESIMQLTADESVPLEYIDLFLEGEIEGFTYTRKFTVYVRSANAIGLSPQVINLPIGSIRTVNVNVSSQHLPATLSAVNPPSGVSFQFMPNPTNSTSTLTITAGFNAQSGFYKVPVVGTFSNGGTASDTLSITITEASGWIQVAQATALYGMDMDEITQTGIAVGYGNTYRSIDGGRTWMMGAPVDTSNTYYSVDLLGTRAVAVSNSGEVALSLNGGQTWTETFAGISKLLNGVSLSDAANGIAAGEGIIIRTRDGGSIWSIVSGVGDPYYFTDVSYRGGSAFVVGLNGTIFRATSYQDNWQQLNSGTTNNLYGVSFANASTGMVVGDGGTVLFTSDGGASWTQRNNPNITRIDRVHMLNTTVATIGGVGGRIFQTTDAGLNWTQDINSLNFERVSDIHLFSNNTGMCLVQDTYILNTVTILRRE
jgi:photosystem II stability/assembly factor-like uncharacterized protein